MNTDYEWIATTLVNDESSSDTEMRQHFMNEGGMTDKESWFYIDQRNHALRDPLGFKLERYEP
jgi:hypothetical protein